MPRIGRLVSSRSIPSGGTGPKATPADFGGGLAALGGVTETAGKEIDAFAKAVKAADSIEALNAANQTALTDLFAEQLKFENDGDFRTVNDRFNEAAAAIESRVAGNIVDSGVGAEFKRQFATHRRKATLAVARAARRNLVDQGRAGLDNSLAGFAAQAVQSDFPPQRDAIVEQGGLAIAGAVETGIIGEQAGGIRRRNFIGGIEAGVADRMIRTDPVQAKRLLEGEDAFANLPANIREGKLRQADAALERARRSEVAGLRREVADAIFVLDTGAQPEGLARLRTSLDAGASIDPGLATLGTELDAAIDDSERMKAFNLLPFDRQSLEIDALAARPAQTARSARLLGAMRRQNIAVVRAAKTDPLAYGAATGLIDLADIDFGDPETMRRRMRQAESVAAHIGAPVSPLRDSELDALARALDKAQPDQVAGIFLSLNRGLGADGAGRVADSIAPKQPAIALAVNLAADNPRLASDIVAGRRLLAENSDLRPGPAERESAVAAVYGDLFQAVPSALAPHIAAAEAIYARRRAPGGDFSFDADAFADALREAAGNPVEFHGRKILPPAPEFDEAVLPDLLAALEPDQLTRFGNGRPVHGNAAPFTAAEFEDSDTQLMTVAPGRYHVFFKGRGFVMTEGGALYELDLARAAPEVLSRLKTGGVAREFLRQ